MALIRTSSLPHARLTSTDIATAAVYLLVNSNQLNLFNNFNNINVFCPLLFFTDQEKSHFLYKRSAAVPVRLVNGTLSSGRVEIQHNNIWGTICDDDFTSQTAGVLCHMLGFSRSVLSSSCYTRTL